MRKAFLKKARETLQEMREQLLRNVQAELHEGREQSKDEGMDTYDLASDARDREINFILTDREREKLQAIDEALARVEEGSYGMCESCESDIRGTPRGAALHPALHQLPGGAREGGPAQQAVRGRPHLPAPHHRRHRRGDLVAHGRNGPRRRAANRSQVAPSPITTVSTARVASNACTRSSPMIVR